MNIKELYGMAQMATDESPEMEEMEEMGKGENESDEARKSFEFSFEPKRESKPIPSNATIKSIRTSIRVCEIENGYLIKKCIYTDYETPVEESKGNEISDGGWGYHEDEKVFFSKTKPSEANLLYGNVK
jgi:hypothetical protein